MLKIDYYALYNKSTFEKKNIINSNIEIYSKFEKRIYKLTCNTCNANDEWRRLQNEELHSLNRSSNIVRMIKSRRLRWADHVARME